MSHPVRIADAARATDSKLRGLPMAGSATVVMGAASAATDLIGRRVRVFFDCSVAKAIEDKRPVRFEGIVRAIGAKDNGLVMWVEQDIDGNTWNPRGVLFSAATADDDGILLLPVEPAT